MTDLYIYYRVRDGDAAQLAPRVRSMQAGLGTGQLKRRPGSLEGVQTWMEIYPGATDDFDAALAAAVQGAELSELIQGGRHTEIFMDFETCV